MMEAEVLVVLAEKASVTSARRRRSSVIGGAKTLQALP